jgi:hypothetical protein
MLGLPAEGMGPPILPMGPPTVALGPPILAVGPPIVALRVPREPLNGSNEPRSVSGEALGGAAGPLRVSYEALNVPSLAAAASINAQVIRSRLTCSAFPLTDGLTEQNRDGATLGSGNVAELDVSKLLAGPFEKTLRIRQRCAVMEAKVYV